MIKEHKGKIGPLGVVIIICVTFLSLYFFVGQGKYDVLGYFYPIKYQSYVEKYSEQYGVDKYLVYAVIKVESKFDSKAISGADAKGLMQLMDNTAIECNKKEKWGYNIPDDLYEPEINIQIGCYYLGSLIKSFKDTRLAVVAYNGGTGNVKQWLKDDKLNNGNGGLSKIPFLETKNYTDKVMKTYEIYKKIYAGVM